MNKAIQGIERSVQAAQKLRLYVSVCPLSFFGTDSLILVTEIVCIVHDIPLGRDFLPEGSESFESFLLEQQDREKLKLRLVRVITAPAIDMIVGSCLAVDPFPTFNTTRKHSFRKERKGCSSLEDGASGVFLSYRLQSEHLHGPTYRGRPRGRPHEHLCGPGLHINTTAAGLRGQIRAHQTGTGEDPRAIWQSRQGCCYKVMMMMMSSLFAPLKT